MKLKRVGVFVVLLWASAALGQDIRPKIAIKTFKNPANFSRSTIGNGLADILTTELQNTGKFTVLERAHVDELTKEMDFGRSDYAKSPSFAQKGNLLGAQYILMGEVTNFSYSEHLERQRRTEILRGTYIQTVYQQQADVRVDFRLVDISTGETTISQAGEAHKTNTSQVSELARWYRVTTSGSITAELSSSLIGRATIEAVKDIVRKLNSLSAVVREVNKQANTNKSLERLASARGLVVGDVGGGLWIVGIGSASGLVKGDRLKVTHENLVKDKAGRVIYRKPVDIGIMEVTDVSESDHAEARLIPDPTNASQNPQVNDKVRVDTDFAPTLRGAVASPPVPGTPRPPDTPGGSPGTPASSQLEQFLKRANSYMTDRFWSQALDQYNQAAALNPSEPRVLQGQALSHYMMGDFVEGDESAEKLLQTDSPLVVSVAHYHALGLCTGQLLLQRGKLTFKSTNADGFDIAASSLAKIEVRRLPKPFFVVGEPPPDWPVMEIRWRDASGHEKKYHMLPYMYSKQQTLTGKNFASAFPMDDSDLGEMQKLEQSLIALIQKYVR